MNDKQKILIMVFVMSFVIFIATGFHYIDGNINGTGYGNFYGYFIRYRGENVVRTNWLGFIALGNIFASLVGIFLFKDKK